MITEQDLIKDVHVVLNVYRKKIRTLDWEVAPNQAYSHDFRIFKYLSKHESKLTNNNSKDALLKKNRRVLERKFGLHNPWSSKEKGNS